MTAFTFYRGVNEIGGNKILLEDQDTRLFLDFGMGFSLGTSILTFSAS
jgi:mRNA degradation ribonuclease J1/J2